MRIPHYFLKPPPKSPSAPYRGRSHSRSKNPAEQHLGDLYKCAWRRSGAFRDTDLCGLCVQTCTREFFESDSDGISERLEAACEVQREAFSARVRNQGHKYRSNKRGKGITAGEWAALLELYRRRCAYCGKSVALSMDHVMPLSKGGLHEASNIVPACVACNSRKRDRSVLAGKQFKLFSH